MPPTLARLVKVAVVAAAALCAAGRPAPCEAQTAEAAQVGDEFFRPDVLHELRLRVNSRDWAILLATYLENTYYPCEVTWDGLRVPNVAVRSRGLFTRSGVKPGLKLDFNRYTPGRRVFGQTALALDNLYQEPSMLREVVTSRVYARLGLVVPRASFARVYVNGRYHGLYAVVEAVEKPFLDRVYGESDGYLFEYRLLEPWFFTYPGPDLAIYLRLFEPRTREDEPIEALVGPIEELVRVVNETDDEHFEEEVGRLLPLDEMVVQVAIDRLTTNQDWIVAVWGMNNLYVYRSIHTGQSRFIPWDLDITMIWPDFDVTTYLDLNVLTRRAFAVPRLQTLFFTTLASAAEVLAEPTAATEGAEPVTWFEALVDQAYALVRDSAREDRLKWFSNEDFEADVEALRRFARERPGDVRCQAARVLDPERAALLCPGR